VASSDTRRRLGTLVDAHVSERSSDAPSSDVWPAGTSSYMVQVKRQRTSSAPGIQRRLIGQSVWRRLT
jgi:hypothetical protein